MHRSRNRFRKVVIHMDESKIAAISNIPQNEIDKLSDEIRKRLVDIIIPYFPQKKDVNIVGSTVCGVERY